MEPTDIRNLDKALGGGLPVPSGILLFGPMGSGKTCLGRQLVARFLAKGYAVMYVTVDEEAESSQKALETQGVNIQESVKSGQLYFLDLFSYGVERLGKDIAGDQDVSVMSSFLQLVSGELLKLVRGFGLKNLGKKQFGFMDSMTPLILSASNAEIYQFSQTFKHLLRFVNGIGVGTLHENVLDKDAESLYMGFADGIIRMTRKNELTGKEMAGGGYLKVLSMKGQKFSPQPIYYSLEQDQILLSDIPTIL